MLAAIVVGTTLPALPVRLLWINMASALMLGLMLVFEPKERGLMQRPPRDPREPDPHLSAYRADRFGSLAADYRGRLAGVSRGGNGEVDSRTVGRSPGLTDRTLGVWKS